MRRSIALLLGSLIAAPLLMAPSCMPFIFAENLVGPPYGVFPRHWIPWTWSGANPVNTGGPFLVRGIRCNAASCRNVGLLAAESGHQVASYTWTNWFSEEAPNEMVCPGNGFITGIACSGSNCDNQQLLCSEIVGVTRTACYWTGWVSEENGGTFIAPQGMWLAGMRCNGSQCDNKDLLLCRTGTQPPSYDLDGLAHTYAPRLRFAQGFGAGSGNQSRCFPSDPATYYTQRQQGTPPVNLCNKDYATIQNAQVPIFYMASPVGDDTVLIRYWFFYALQGTCQVIGTQQGGHDADWECMAVLIQDGQLVRAGYCQHGGWYTNNRDGTGIETVNGTHPVGYVGLTAHGTYDHPSNGCDLETCSYYCDPTDPGSQNRFMDTWLNLQRLHRDAGAPAWMACTGSGCFDGIGHPIEQTGDLRSMAGCNKDGCSRSDLGGLPFVSDWMGGDFTTAYVSSTSKALSVQGAGTADFVPIEQRDGPGTDDQRFMLESVNDPASPNIFILRARNSWRCMDVSGASTAPGAAVIQYGCGWPYDASANQRMELVRTANGSFEIRPRHSGLCLGIEGASVYDGARLVQQTCNGSLSQRFFFFE